MITLLLITSVLANIGLLILLDDKNMDVLVRDNYIEELTEYRGKHERD